MSEMKRISVLEIVVATILLFAQDGLAVAFD